MPIEHDAPRGRRTAGFVLALMAATMLTACAAPHENKPTLEATPLSAAILPPTTALTLAQTRAADGRAHTLAVVAQVGGAVQALDLTVLGAPLDADMLDALAAVDETRLAEALASPGAAKVYTLSSLLPAGGTSTRHLASGTNFPEHAEETELASVFNFPKFGPPSGPYTTVRNRPGDILDYEIELCLRMDRDVRSVADFDAARKGFFLCGDFSERATMLRLLDPKNVASGRGFTDAKSRPDYYPTGPFLVVPRDWTAFVKTERIVNEVNGKVRQDARGGEMTLDFRQLTEKALKEHAKSFPYQGKEVPLLDGAVIPKGSAVMSGTPEGVIFVPPGKGDIARGVAVYIFTGGWLRGQAPMQGVVQAYARHELASGRYLKAGDIVRHESSSMGALEVKVVGSPSSPAN